MRCKLHRIHIADCAGATGLGAHGFHVIDGAGAVGGVAHRDNSGLVAQYLVQGIVGELKRIGIKLDPFDGGTGVGRHQQPWCHIRIMIHPRQDNLVAFA